MTIIHFSLRLISSTKLIKVITLSLPINRRINRPGVYDLNPFQRLNNDLSKTEGNPYLEPELTDKLQLTYALNAGKSNISPHIFMNSYQIK
ncbi:MAG: outer membrane beta-barrel protein [Chloroflexia bacterium]|nr:outer membrane beta-barrel protein [Chloroflexia bacterium]